MPVFELIDPVAAAPPAVVGLWETTPATPPEALAFSSPATPEAPVWRANLPADPVAAAAHCAAAEARLAAAQQALALAEQRLTALVAGHPTDAGVSFTTPAAPLAAPERDLLRLLGVVEPDEAAVSFGIGAWAGAGWEKASEQFQAALKRLEQTVLYAAWVETRVDAQLLGRTAVGWGGATGTAWAPGVTPEQIDLHRRTLVLALNSRQEMLRTLALVVRGAALLATMVAAPARAVLALPAAWQFVNEVVAELTARETQPEA